MIRGGHVVALAAIVLTAVALRATEFYASRYQTLPVQDWLESRPPLAESAALPSAQDLAREFARAVPLLVIRDDARPRTPVFGPPAIVQRTVGGVRDASRIEFGAPGQFDEPQKVPIRARADVIVFNRAVRAAAWSDLLAYEMDVRDPDSGDPQTRVSGPDEPDGVWLIAPSRGGGVATIAGHRGTVGFMLQVTLLASLNGGDRVDLSGRAEAVARQAAADWARWLATQGAT